MPRDILYLPRMTHVGSMVGKTVGSYQVIVAVPFVIVGLWVCGFVGLPREGLLAVTVTI